MAKRKTDKELDDEMQQALETKPDDASDTPPDDEPETPPDDESPTKDDDAGKPPDDQSPSDDEHGDDADDESKPDEVDALRKKAAASGREAIVQRAKSNQLAEALNNAKNLPDATDEEMAKAYSNWEDLDETTKQIARDSYNSKRRSEAILKATEKFNETDTWIKTVDDFISDPKTLVKYKVLEGRTEEFQEFASKPTRRNMDLADLVAAFAYDIPKTRVKHKGSQQPIGAGGRDGKPRSKAAEGKISLEEAQRLMQTDYKKYKQYLENDKIDYNTIE